ncbi:hypothetical protein JWG41_18185 [Leptospira sp. 201903075]|uniref:hypothetical protein n=1 Tax=Leptospira chreensis TaxID=2810035 RepID=UPI0019652C9C|nr:hypothetical protein [Leptospira chreensis]MBM9592378.1 hypothetical protein [Leptospira chreensis]
MLTNLSLVVLQLLLWTDGYFGSTEKRNATFVSHANWETTEDQVYAPSDKEENICKFSSCSISELVEKTDKFLSYSFSDIINKEYEFLAFDANRKHVLSVVTASKTIQPSEGKDKKEEGHFVVGNLLMLTSIEKLERQIPSYAGPATSYKHKLVVGHLILVHNRTQTSEILAIIEKYINLPPPVA